MRFWSIRGLFPCLFVALCASAPGGEVVRVGGSGAGLGGLQALANAFEQRHPSRSILILPSIGSSGGIRAVMDGKLDVGCTSRPLHPEERVPGLAEVPWVTTPFAFATHPGTPPEELTLPGIEDIYAGRRTRWRDGTPIRLILRPKSDGAFSYLASLSPSMRAALDHAHALPGVSVGITDQEALAQLEKTPGSFGTTVLGLVVSERRQVQALRVNGAHPSDPAYPFFLTLSLVHRPGTASAAVRDFLAFVGSKDGRRILLKAGYRPHPDTPPGKGR